ncbi:MAG: anti-sigma factor [Vicinamibacterales bacterium]
MAMDCQEIEARLAAVADGGTPADDDVTRHLASCAACRQALQAQTTARTVLRARAAQLSVAAPPGLRTRIAATARAERPEARGVLSWRGRLSAFSAAALIVLVLGAALVPVVTGRFTVVLAAQMALDHLKCFVIDGDGDGAAISKADAEALLKREYGWTMSVPASSAADGLELVAVRHCLYGDGLAAHLLYRAGGQPVSLFIMPGLVRPAARLQVFGHDEVVWTQGDRTYMLVAGAGSTAGLARVASYLQNEAK